MATTEFEIHDPEGDRVTLEPIPEREGMPDRVHLSASSGGVYLSLAEIRSIADAAEEILGDVRPERFQPRVEDLLESKSDEPLQGEVEGDALHDLTVRLPLIEAAKDVLRRALPEGDTYVLLDLTR